MVIVIPNRKTGFERPQYKEWVNCDHVQSPV
jgi:hypothetical protein